MSQSCPLPELIQGLGLDGGDVVVAALFTARCQVHLLQKGALQLAQLLQQSSRICFVSTNEVNMKQKKHV